MVIYLVGFQTNCYQSRINAEKNVQHESTMFGFRTMGNWEYTVKKIKNGLSKTDFLEHPNTHMHVYTNIKQHLS